MTLSALYTSAAYAADDTDPVRAARLRRDAEREEKGGEPYEQSPFVVCVHCGLHVPQHRVTCFDCGEPARTHPARVG